MKSPPPYAVFAEIYRRHGHRCPMSTLGGRIGHAARARLTAAPARGLYYIATCAADGIEATTGLSRESGSFRVNDSNRHALWLVGADGSAIFAELHPETLQRSAGYRALRQRLETERDTLSEAEIAIREQEILSFLDRLLEELRTLPEDELIRFSSQLPPEFDPYGLNR